MKLADSMLIGGAMAYTFLKSQGLPIGKSLVENDKLDLAREITRGSESSAISVSSCPSIISSAVSLDSTATRVTDIAHTPDGCMGLDIGPSTVACFRRKFPRPTIFWNGPVGIFEKPALPKARWPLRAPLRRRRPAGATSIVGGGDSVAAVEQSGVASQISHISTGGGASLEFLAGEKLPGVEALTEKS